MEKLEPEVDVLVDLQLSDRLRANLWQRYSKRSTKLGNAVSAAITLLFAVFVFFKEMPATYLLLPLAIWLMEAFIFLVIVIETKKNYAALKDFQRKIQYHLDPEGYTVRDGKTSANVSWDSILSAVESKHSLNLFISRTLFVVLPKRCFKTSSDLEMARAILKTALPGKAKLG
jgi:YcxB-like protein